MFHELFRTTVYKNNKTFIYNNGVLLQVDECYTVIKSVAITT